MLRSHLAGRTLAAVSRRRGGCAAARPMSPVERAGACALASAAPSEHYRLPPPEVASFVERPESPGLSLSPDRSRVLYLHRPPPFPSVAELARPELRLAGLRIDPASSCRSRLGHNTGLEFAPLPADAAPGPGVRVTGVPPGALINFVKWSPHGSRVAFTVRGSGVPGCPSGARGALGLWVADVATAAAALVAPGWALGAALADYEWVDEARLVAPVVPAGRPAGAPPRPAAPPGPRVQVSAPGEVAQARTYADLLKDEHDAALFEHFCATQLLLVTLPPPPANGAAPAALTLLDGGAGSPARLYTRCDASPDGRWLLVEWLERPFSYALPAGRFPKRVQLWRLVCPPAGGAGAGAGGSAPAAELARLPLADAVPIVHDAVRAGPRGFGWRADAACEVAWTEARDGGDPRAPASPRDVVLAATADALAAHAAAPAAPAPPPPAREIFRTDWRCGGVAWGDDSLALAFDSQYKVRGSRTYALAPGPPGRGAAAGAAAGPARLLLSRDYEDAYSDPGSPLAARRADGAYVLAILEPEGEADGAGAGGAAAAAAEQGPRERPGRRLLFQGPGAGPEGLRPFMDLFDLDSGAAVRRLFACAGPQLAQPGSLLTAAPLPRGGSLAGVRLLVTRETPRDVPQYGVLTLDAAGGAASEVTITRFPHPHPQLVAPPKEVIRYARADGVELSGTLYTPPGWRAGVDAPLPCLVWAYPREFKTPAAAGQLRTSPFSFTSISPLSPAVWLARGYAVLDGPSLPIVSPAGGAEPNDTYVSQLVAGATAAVDELVRRGVAAPGRLAVGGSSYGAFMAANLLAHAPGLFACGVALSGAYNRTLTPFGFQAEERTLWQAPAVYGAMSPFSHADRIRDPLLLVHGVEDANPGTQPQQSERLFAALRGFGAPARLVLLPHEGHATRARESVLHLLAELSDWMDAHTAAPPKAGGGCGAPPQPEEGAAPAPAQPLVAAL